MTQEEGNGLAGDKNQQIKEFGWVLGPDWTILDIIETTREFQGQLTEVTADIQLILEGRYSSEEQGATEDDAKVNLAKYFWDMGHTFQGFSIGLLSKDWKTNQLK